MFNSQTATKTRACWELGINLPRVSTKIRGACSARLPPWNCCCRLLMCKRPIIVPPTKENCLGQMKHALDVPSVALDCVTAVWESKHFLWTKRYMEQPPGREAICGSPQTGGETPSHERHETGRHQKTTARRRVLRSVQSASRNNHSSRKTP